MPSFSDQIDETRDWQSSWHANWQNIHEIYPWQPAAIPLQCPKQLEQKHSETFGPKLLSLLLTQNISATIYVLLETEQLIGSSIIDLEISSC